MCVAVVALAITHVPVARAATTYPPTPGVEVGAVVCIANGVAVRTTGWFPNSTVAATLFSTPVSLGTFPVDASGTADFTFQHETRDRTFHTLRIDGSGTDGQPRRIESTIFNDCSLPSDRVAVAGAVLNADAVRARASSGGGAFGATGREAQRVMAVAFDLIAAGAVLRLAAARSRRALS